MKNLAVVLVVVAMGILAGGCATTRAQAPAARMPALEVPPVPPRVIEPPPPLPTPLPDPVGELPPAQPPSTSKPKPQPRDTTQKPEPKPPETTAEQPPVASANPPAPAVPPLRTAATIDGAKAERQVRETIGRANTLLGKVDYRTLSAERRKAYDDAKRFLEASDTALKGANYEYAQRLADTAETLAKELQG